jgi:hypothetical protein
MHPVRSQYVHTQKVLVPRADAYLHGRSRIDQALLDSFVEHGPVIKRVNIVIGPSIAVSIKVNQRQRLAELFRMGIQER